MRTPRVATKEKGISVILVTNRIDFMDNLFANYHRQRHKTKELILVLNHDKMNLREYRRMARQYFNVSVYKLPQSISLGHCLNYAVTKSKYDLVTKFDDDDYYSRYYLSGIISAFHHHKVDVVGKYTCFSYLERSRSLRLMHPGNSHKYTTFLMGGTISFRKRVFRKVQFRNVSRGEDDRFFWDCRAKGIRIYSTDKYNYVYIRRRDAKSHTWKVQDDYIKNLSIPVLKTSNFSKYVTRRVVD